MVKIKNNTFKIRKLSLELSKIIDMIYAIIK
jgi:hypothetical protein